MTSLRSLSTVEIYFGVFFGISIFTNKVLKVDRLMSQFNYIKIISTIQE